MKNARTFVTAVVLCAVALFVSFRAVPGDDRIASVIIDPRSQTITMHLRDGGGAHYRNIGKLEEEVRKSRRMLRFAMNGGMYKPDHDPVGLYIENGEVLARLVTAKGGSGNFNMQPNGVFGIASSGEAFVVTTEQAARMESTRFATQSGPMLVVDGAINAQFKEGSANLNIRNGVGVLPDGKVLFAISTVPVNFHDFASFFKEHGCADALYLDGAVSKAFMPSESLDQRDGDLGVLIAVIE